MSIAKSLSLFVGKESHQKKISIFARWVVVGSLLLRFAIKASRLLPDDSLFLFTSDAFELLLSACIGIFLYNRVFSSKSLVNKLAFICLAVLFLIGLAYLKSYRRGLSGYGEVYSDFTSYVGIVFIFASLFYLVDHLDLFFNNAFNRTRKALKEAQMQLLRQQFNPHFLFNALNSVYGMSLNGHPKTSDTILKISGMMRYLTDETSIHKVRVKRELSFIRDYIEVERIRFGEGADIRFEVDGDHRDMLIEPLLMITLVENAFKHGFYTNDDRCFVHVFIKVDKESLKLRVTNSVVLTDHLAKEVRLGRGLESLRQRLELVYPQRHTLIIKKEEDIHKAILKIKFSNDNF